MVRGNSGTGKTTLYDMVADHTRNGSQSGVQITRGISCVALVDIDWLNQLNGISNSVVFVDEGARYILSEDFARAIKATDNYYVIFSREPLHQLPYSVNEIYYIKTSGKFHSLEPLYRRKMRNVYGAASPSRADYGFLLTEDSKAGFEFYAKRFEDSSLICESAGSKSNVFNWLEAHEGERVFVIADGAAFGPEAERVLKLQEIRPASITVCLPESFEWLLLSTGLVGDDNLPGVLKSPSEHIDPSKYESWEQYFTSLLVELSKDTPFAYTKRHLSQAWLVEANANKVMELIRNHNVK